MFGQGRHFFNFQHYLRSNLRDSLSRRGLQVELEYSPGAGQCIPTSICPRKSILSSPEFNNRFVQVTRRRPSCRSGPPADRSFDPSAVSVMAVPTALGSAAPITEIVGDQHMMIRATPVDADSGKYLVELGVSIVSMDDVLSRLLDLLALLLPVLIVCAAGGGYWLVRRALRPVDLLSQTAEQMSLQNLTLRLPVAPSGDALERLSISLNNSSGATGRLSAMTSRRFLAVASHELRTPLTVIKGSCRSSPVRSIWTKHVRERVGSILEEVARLEHLVSGVAGVVAAGCRRTRGSGSMSIGRSSRGARPSRCV